MKKNEMILKKIIDDLFMLLSKERYVIDKTGVRCVELIANNIIGLSPKQSFLDFNVKKTNEDYCKKELGWYLSQSLSIIDYVDDVKIWNDVASKDGKKYVNSNYGWCIFSDDNFNQYKFVLDELKDNKFSRRASMIYNRPSMAIDYKKNGMNDYMCTNYVQCLIRDDRLIYNVHQRSCDFIFGFFNDFYWHCYVYDRLFDDLRYSYDDLKIGYINYICDSLHIYERHFDLLKDIYKYLNGGIDV